VIEAYQPDIACLSRAGGHTMERLVEVGTDHDDSGLIGLATRLVRNRLQQDSVMHNLVL
jgi:hypothetical protein